MSVFDIRNPWAVEASAVPVPVTTIIRHFIFDIAKQTLDLLLAETIGTTIVC